MVFTWAVAVGANAATIDPQLLLLAVVKFREYEPAGVFAALLSIMFTLSVAPRRVVLEPAETFDCPRAYPTSHALLEVVVTDTVAVPDEPVPLFVASIDEVCFAPVNEDAMNPLVPAPEKDATTLLVPEAGLANPNKYMVSLADTLFVLKETSWVIDTPL